MFKMSAMLTASGLHIPDRLQPWFDTAWLKVVQGLEQQGFSNITVSAKAVAVHDRVRVVIFGARHGRWRFGGKGVMNASYPAAEMWGDIQHGGFAVAAFRMKMGRQLRLRCRLLEYAMSERRGYENYSPGSANCA